MLRSSPSMATSLSLHEMHYLFAKLTVAEIMNKGSDRRQSRDDGRKRRAPRPGKAGGMPAGDGERSGGGDPHHQRFLYLLLNPILGIGEKGSRLIVRQCADLSQITQALQCAMDLELEVLNAAYMSSRRGGQHEFILHVNTEDATKLLERMRSRGLEVELRER